MQNDDIVKLSALTGEGTGDLLDRLGEMLTSSAAIRIFDVPVGDGRKIAWLHAHGEVLAEEEVSEGDEGPLRRLTVRLNQKQLGQFETL